MIADQRLPSSLPALQMGMLEDPTTRSPDPRQIQSHLLGFLSTHTAPFTAKLWDLLLSAQTSLGGVPNEFVEEKKRELREADERDRKAASGQFRGGGVPGAPPTATVAGGFMSQRTGGGGGYSGGGGGGVGQRGPPQGMTRDSGYASRPNSRFDQPGPPPAGDYVRPSTRDRSPPPHVRRGRSPSPVGRRDDGGGRRRDSRSPDDRYRRDHRDHRDHRPSPPRRRGPSRSPPPPGRYTNRDTYIAPRSPTPPTRGADSYGPRRSPLPEQRRRRSPSPDQRRRRSSPDPEYRRRPRSPAPREREREPSRTPPRKARHRSFTPTPPPEERGRARSLTP